MISDKGLIFFSSTNMPVDTFGTLIDYRAIIHTFAEPIIILFLGGYFLAIAATKYRLDNNLAKILLKPFGTNPNYVLLGLMIITATFSMFMSNTATTAMMLAILTPVLAHFDKNDPGCKAFIIAIPFAANVGGLGTPIGTPPNAVAMKYLTNDLSITFAQWMSFGVPFAFILLIFTWFILLKLYSPQTKSLKIDISDTFLKTPQAITVYITFTATILLWLTGKIHGINSYIVAMLPIATFTATGIIGAKDLKLLSWDVLWLVSGGIALGLGMEQTGLSTHIINMIPFTEVSPLILILIATILTITMATFMSNTATANLLMPIMVAIGTSFSNLKDFGGGKMLLIGVAFSASLAMTLPVSTPPNAMAHATGILKSGDMIKPGLIVGVAGILMTYTLLYIMVKFGFFNLQ